MALFEGIKRKEGTRSHTHLVKSGHTSPAVEWKLDQNLNKPEYSGVLKDGSLFHYQYGGPGQEEVVIPKGRLVGVGASQKSFVNNRLMSVITVPALSRNNNTIGIVPFNICKDAFEQDRFGGNQPTILTEDLVELPYMPLVAAEAMGIAGYIAEEQKISHENKMPWGAVIGSGIGPGDWLKSTPSGRLTKWDPIVDAAIKPVGQIIGEDMNSDRWGWMEWILWDESARYEDETFVNSGVSNLPSASGYPFDPEYKEGYREDVLTGYQGELVTNPTGIPGLHNGEGNFIGYGRRDTEFNDTPMGTIPAAAVNDTLVMMNIKDYAGVNKANIREGVVIKIDGTAVAADRLTINYKTGEVTIKATLADAGKAVTASYKAEFYGSPSHMDFTGVVGSFFVLLHM